MPAPGLELDHYCLFPKLFWATYLPGVAVLSPVSCATCSLPVSDPRLHSDRNLYQLAIMLKEADDHSEIFKKPGQTDASEASVADPPL